MCAAFSALISEYEFAAAIIGKFTFLGIFIPLAYAVSNLMNIAFNPSIATIKTFLHLPWIFCWMPNVVYLHMIIKRKAEDAVVLLSLGDIKGDPDFVFQLLLVA